MYTADRIAGRRRLLAGVAGLALGPIAAACSRQPMPTAEPARASGAGPKPAESPKAASAEFTASPADRNRRFNQYHHPKVEGKEVSTKPYIYLPFKQGTIYKVDEGWMYGAEEFAIHGETEHKGIDWSVPYGTPVYSPVDGWVMASYQHQWNRYDDGPNKGQLRPYRGIPGEDPIGFDLGLFNMFYVPETGRFIFIGHLSDTTVDISVPTKSEDGQYIASNNRLTQEQRTEEALSKNPAYRRVKRGELVGYVGTSGLMKGRHQEWNETKKKVVQVPTWDEPHVHFEEFSRLANAAKAALRDPYGLYDLANYYPYPEHQPDNHNLAPILLFREPTLVLDNGVPAYAA